MLHSISFADADGGVDVVLAAMAGQVVRHATPSRALSTQISAHAIAQPSDIARGADRSGRVTSRLPGQASIRIVQDTDGGSASIGNHRYPKLPPITLIGPTSRAPLFASRNAMVVEVALTPAGWNAVAGVAANKLANRITPLVEVAPDLTGRIERAVPTLCPQTAVAALDAAFAALIGRRHHDAEHVAAFGAMIEDAQTMQVGVMASGLDMTEPQLRRMTMRHFGFPPKLLVMRKRFADAFARWLADPTLGAEAMLANGYFDASHFLRDATKFLGTTPRRYVDRLTALPCAA